MSADLISPDLKTVLRRMRLSPILDTLPERLALARQQKMAHQDFLLLVLSDETARRDSLATSLRVQRARLDPAMQLELWTTPRRSPTIKHCGRNSCRCASSSDTLI